MKSASLFCRPLYEPLTNILLELQLWRAFHGLLHSQGHFRLGRYGGGRGIAAFVLRPPSLHVLRDRLEACKTRRRVCIKCSVCKCWIVWKERVGDEPDVMTPPLFRDPPLGQRRSESQRHSRPQAQQRRPLGRYYCQFKKLCTWCLTRSCFSRAVRDFLRNPPFASQPLLPNSDGVRL